MFGTEILRHFVGFGLRAGLHGEQFGTRVSEDRGDVGEGRPPTGPDNTDVQGGAILHARVW